MGWWYCPDPCNKWFYRSGVVESEHNFVWRTGWRCGMRNHFLRASGKKPSIISDISITGTSVNPNALSSYTFSSVSIGAPSAFRTVLVFVGALNNGGRGLTSITIGGSAATVYAYESNSLSGSIACIAGRQVSAGSSADIVVTFNGTVNNYCSIAAAMIVSPSAISVADTYNYDSGFGGVLSYGDTTTTTNGGLLLICGNSESTKLSSWSGVNEKYNIEAESGSGDYHAIATSLTSAPSKTWSGGATTNGSAALVAVSLSFS